MNQNLKFDDTYFAPFTFTPEQIARNLANAEHDLSIAKQDTIREVKFSYAYTALIKAIIALLSAYHKKVKSIPGYHVKLLDKTAEILKDDTIAVLGNSMRSKRNTDLYSGGIEVTEKEVIEYLDFVEKVIDKIKKVIH